MTGDAAKAMMLFDLEADLGEQHDVAARNPEVVKRLKAFFDKMDAEAAELAPPPRRGPVGTAPGVMRLKGGALRYDQVLP